MTRADSAESLCSLRRRENASVCTAYGAFLLCAGVVVREFSDGDFSLVLTASAGVQCLGFLLLLLKVKHHKTVAGISARTLELYVLVFSFRLSSTLFMNGYLPVDRSGDWAYQVADVTSMMLVLQLLCCVRKSHRATYLEECDTLDVRFAVPICLMLAVFFHGSLNKSPLFDALWSVSTNLEVIAMLPQLWLLSKLGGEVDGMTSHFVAAQALSRVLAFAFWFYGCKEVDAKGTGPNVAGALVLVAHGMQVLASADFMYHYGRAVLAGSKMVLPVLDV